MARQYECPNKDCKQFEVKIQVPGKKVKALAPPIEIKEGKSALVESLLWEANSPLYVTYPENVLCGYCGRAAIMTET